ncbi:MAG: acylphosphatase [Burkholderiales bacterium]
MTDAVVTRLLSIRGRVQGVGFRDAMCAEATRLQVRGWVRNRRDGSVEAMIQGTPDQLAAMEQWVHRGPPAAQVLRVEVTEGYGSFSRFDRWPTA